MLTILRACGYILDQPPDLPLHLDSAVEALATATSHHDWQRLDDIDVPLQQQHLSLAIDESIYN